MNKQSNFYCRMESLCRNQLIFDREAEKSKSKYVSNENVYVEYFENINLLKKRVLALTDSWKNRFEYNKEITHYPGLYIINKYNQDKAIGFCFNKWYICDSEFSRYARKYLYSNFQEKYLANIEKLETKPFVIDSSWELFDCELNLLTEKIFDTELNLFLNQEKATEKIKQDLFYPEIVERGYINIYK